MERPSQEPDTPPDGAESPLSFPARPPAGLDPVVPQAEPLRFPAEASRSESPLVPGEPRAEPLGIPAEAPSPEPLPPVTGPPPQDHPRPFPAAVPPLQPVARLPYPVAHIPGAAPAAEPATEPPADPPPVTATAPALLRFVSPALAILSALLTALGVFLPLFLIRETLGGDRSFDAEVSITETAWGHIFELPGQEATEQAGSPLGLPLLCAAVLLVVAAVVALLRPDRPLGRWLVAAGAVFGAGVVFTIATDGIGWGAGPAGAGVDVTVGPGMWLAVAGTVAAVAAAVLAHLPRRPGWADPAVAYADTPTPPSGVAITVLPPDEDGDEHPGPPLR
ncbi:hypothetical protein [Amycolatopsis sp. lyj-23]|uniref:hypothetical protein n=1 Tax=Amycolatopsis sp. lyj-23 TaxID=2789283 RepID=UPI003978FC4F